VPPALEIPICRCEALYWLGSVDSCCAVPPETRAWPLPMYTSSMPLGSAAVLTVTYWLSWSSSVSRVSISWLGVWPLPARALAIWLLMEARLVASELTWVTSLPICCSRLLLYWFSCAL